MKFAVDWLAVAPGEIYPRMFVAGSDCPAGLLDDARAAGVLAAEAPQPAQKGRRK